MKCSKEFNMDWWWEIAFVKCAVAIQLNMLHDYNLLPFDCQKKISIQNRIQYNLMLCRAFFKTFQTQTNLINSENHIQMFKRAWFLEVQETLHVGNFIGRKLLLKFELWIVLSQNYSKFSYESEITRKSRKPSASGRRRFCRTSRLPVSRRMCGWWRLVWNSIWSCTKTDLRDAASNSVG